MPPDLARPPAGCRFAAALPVRHAGCCRDEDPGCAAPIEVHRFACFHPAPTASGRGRAAARPAVPGGGRAVVRRPDAAVAPLLELDGVPRSSRSPPACCSARSASVKAVSGVSFSVMPPGDVRAGRRVRLRQDDHRPADRRAGAADAGSDQVRRRGPGHADAAAGYAGRAADVQLMFQDS